MHLSPLSKEIDWLQPIFHTQIKMVRQYHRIIKLQNTRLTKVVLLWDLRFSEKYPHLSTWSSDVKQIFRVCGLGYFSDNLTSFPLRETIGTLKSKIKAMQNGELKTKCSNKPQLRNFIQFSDFDETPCHLVKPLTFIQGKFLCKLTTATWGGQDLPGDRGVHDGEARGVLVPFLTSVQCLCRS